MTVFSFETERENDRFITVNSIGKRFKIVDCKAVHYLCYYVPIIKTHSDTNTVKI